jgi:1,4-alpha-glucan branching enzyme
MTVSGMEAIVGGYHGDPFRILGPHRVRKVRGKPCWEVRAFLPFAKTAAVLIGDGVHPMKRTHDQGFFVAELEGTPEAYRFRIERWHGQVDEVDDAFRFPPLLTDFELHLHGEGTNFETYRTMGAHAVECEGVRGVRFAVWAPNAIVVSVVGPFNDWDTRCHAMRLRTGGVWEIFIPGIGEGALYKFLVKSRYLGYQQQKADPYAFFAETPPRTASVVWDIDKYQWNDQAWTERRGRMDWLKQPVSVYEIHLESWLRKPDHTSLSYRELAKNLVNYVKSMGYTHIELMPLMEHPFSGSWGYQVIGYYSPTSRFGTPEDFMYLIDCCHQAGVGVIMDWVPAHFPKDGHGLAWFDGTALYEHADPRQGEHRDWGTLIFNFGRNEVREFLIANALFWLKQYHIDGLRVDAVASMLYLDYSRKAGEWVPNQYGGNENLEAVDFVRRFNELAHAVPGVITIAEESTAFSGVSRPVYLNGLGFTMKWNMGWMHDMLDYFSKETIYRKYHHNNITFSLLYAFTENFVLPISHDEVVHGKKSLIGKMPGDEWQRFANVRAFFAFMYTHPGKKLHFMGSELGQYEEWNHDAAVRWELLSFDYHRKLQLFVRELNWFYRANRPLYEVDFHWSGFEWADFHDADNSIISFVRYAEDRSDFLLICCNFTPVPRIGYEVGVPAAGYYAEVLNSDSELFGGSNMGNGGGAMSRPEPRHGRADSLKITLPPLSVVIFRKR